MLRWRKAGGTAFSIDVIAQKAAVAAEAQKKMVSRRPRVERRRIGETVRRAGAWVAATLFLQSEPGSKNSAWLFQQTPCHPCQRAHKWDCNWRHFQNGGLLRETPGIILIRPGCYSS